MSTNKFISYILYNKGIIVVQARALGSLGLGTWPGGPIHHLALIRPTTSIRTPQGPIWARKLEWDYTDSDTNSKPFPIIFNLVEGNIARKHPVLDCSVVPSRISLPSSLLEVGIGSDAITTFPDRTST